MKNPPPLKHRFRYNIEICEIQKSPYGYGELFGTPSLFAPDIMVDYSYNEAIEKLAPYTVERVNAFTYKIIMNGISYRAQLKFA